MIKTVKGKFFNNNKIYYKVTNAEECHHGLQFHDGLNEDIIPFSYVEEYIPGGIYFTDIKNIFRFLNYGCYIREITVPDDALVFKEGYKYKANKLIFGKRMDINLDTVKYFAENGTNKDQLLIKASEQEYLDIVKYILDNGANIHADDDCALRWAVEDGRLNMVKYLVEKGADIHARNDYALIHSIGHGYLDIVKYLVDNGANIHADNNCVLMYAAKNGYLDIIKYIAENISATYINNDKALRLAIKNNHLDVIKYLVENSAKLFE